MHRMARIGFMTLGIAFVGALSGGPVFAVDKHDKSWTGRRL